MLGGSEESRGLRGELLCVSLCVAGREKKRMVLVHEKGVV